MNQPTIRALFLAGLALVCLAVVDGWVDVVEVTMQPSALGVWVRQ